MRAVFRYKHFREALAVGDAAFQKKCLGKMAYVGREERPVLILEL